MADSPPRGRGCVAVILAAGKSTRMRSLVPKPLHPVCGRPLTLHVVEACREAGIERVIVVIGHEAERVREGLGGGVEYALQREQRGSADAAKAAAGLLAGFEGDAVILAGDVPLLRAVTLRKLIDTHVETSAAATLLTAFLEDPSGYGRIVRNAEGRVQRIVEHRDATPEERAIREWNPSLYCFRWPSLAACLEAIQPVNAQGEYYLTDAIGLLAERGETIAAVPAEDAREVFGVNTRVELAEAERAMRERILCNLMLSGVTIRDPAATYVEAGVRVGQDTVLEPGTHLLGETRIGERCTIGPMSRLSDCEVGDDSAILMSQVVRSRVGQGVRIGPFANVRPGCSLANGVRIGDFVELKNAELGESVCASHLAYLGDAIVGAGANIGAGTITCNYDGERKHLTEIGVGAFVGSNSTLVAPVKIGEDAFVAAASAITKDVPPGALGIGRSRQENREGWVERRKSRGKRDEEAE